MRRNNFAAFDEQVPVGSDSTRPVFTSNELNSRLGQYDQLAIQVILDNVTGSPPAGFDLYVEHSADGRNFVLMNPALAEPQSGLGEVRITTHLAHDRTNVAWGSINGNVPLLAYVRFRMFFSANQTSAHVRVLVTQRDQGA